MLAESLERVFYRFDAEEGYFDIGKVGDTECREVFLYLEAYLLRFVIV